MKIKVLKIINDGVDIKKELADRKCTITHLSYKTGFSEFYLGKVISGLPITPNEARKIKQALRIVTSKPRRSKKRDAELKTIKK